MDKPASVPQLNVFNTWEKEDCNILISAGAGTGKTTTLMGLLERCKHRTLFLAFNKSIQEDIQGKIEKRGLSQGLAKTLHSLGLDSLKTKYRRLNVVSSKRFELVKQLQKDHKIIFKKIKWEDRLKLSYTLMDLFDVSRNYLTNDLEVLKKHLASMDKPFNNHKQLPMLWEEMIKLNEASYVGEIINIDFIDMIYLPLHLDLTIPIYPTYLFVDEAQDLNLCQHGLIDKLVSQGTIEKWCAVGDRKQAIYGFSGASSNSFDMFLSKPGTVKELPLDINYRSKPNIIDSANEVFDVLRSFRTEDGIVKTINEPAFIQPNSMIVCRNIAPLIDLYFQMLALSKPCYIKSADIMAGVVRYMKPYTKETVIGARYEMSSELNNLAEKRGEENRMKAYIAKENFAIFKLLTKHLATDTMKISDLLIKLKTLYVKKTGASMLCSIHKSKGLEADIVYILNENLIPSKFAKSKEQLLQEQHLKYVARTRAKDEMYFLNL